MNICSCGYSTENKKSFSNHTRFGCPNKVRSLGIRCMVCGNELLKKHQTGKQAKYYCSHACYAKDRGLRGSYKEGFVIISGYKYLYNPHHPYATKKGYVAEHRMIAEKTANRYLLKNEVAHHVNEDKLDNRPENIMIMTTSEHSRHHQNFRK